MQGDPTRGATGKIQKTVNHFGRHARYVLDSSFPGDGLWQLGRTREAKVAVDKLLKLYPDFPHQAREYRNYIPDTAIEHSIDGLRKAGLDVPPEKKEGKRRDAHPEMLRTVR